MGEAATAGGDRVNILVVDDSADNRLSLETILSEPGQAVVTAASGRDALRRLLEQEFAVILLDVKMPVMDGFETAALVRQRKSSERTPIIFITAFSDEVHVSRGYSLGAVDYIVSPVVPEVLRSKVAVFVDLFRKTEQIRRQAESLRRRADQLYHLTEASLAINSADTLDEILEIVTETARDLLAPLCAMTMTNLEQAQRAARPAAAGQEGAAGTPPPPGPLVPPIPPALPAPVTPLAPLASLASKTEPDAPARQAAAPGRSGAGDECEERRFMAQAAAVTAALGDQSRTVLLTPQEVASDPRWRFLQEAAEPGDAGGRRRCGAAESGWLAAPLTGRDGRSFGWVHLAGRVADRGEFGDEDRTILTQLAQLASIAIENVLSSEAREANRLKDEFLTTLSHELRTPLTAILGWTRVLRTSPAEPERFAHGLEVIERNVAAQAKLIEDLLDVSRIIAGKLRVSLRPIPLLSSIETAVEAMRPAAEAKGVNLGLAISPEVDQRAIIAGDADRLQQVGWNLLSNAIKFTAPGGRIEIAVGRTAGSFQVRVTDTGKGISPQFLRHVFDRFRQDDSSSTRAHGGLGIGLAIVQHIIELHGGRVEAESPGVNRGATFTVTLPELAMSPAALAALAPLGPLGPLGSLGTPLSAGAAPEALPGEPGMQGPGAPGASAAMPHAAAAGRGAIAAGDLGRLRLLVVDDEPDTREILGEILRSAGAAVATASSLGEALAACDRFRPDLLISDIAMPGGDGYALIRQLRRRGPESCGRVPAIAVSAHAREEDRRRALAAGFERYVTKPVEPADLLAVVREVAAGLPVVAGGEDAPAAGGEVTLPGGDEAPREAPPAFGLREDEAPLHGSGSNGFRPEGSDSRGAAAAGSAGGSAAPPGAAASEPPPTGDNGAKRILLVEDDADTREALKTLLELSGHQVAVAADGGEAVAHAVANRPDVALVDIGLPEIDGNEVARRIRAQLGAGGIFLVALTGYGGEIEEALARAAGFDAHFTKPVELSRLDRLLRAHVRAAP